MCTAHVKSATNQGMPYQPFGDLRISFPGHGRYDNYYRELSLDSARTVVRYSVDGVNYTRETFASFPDQVVITRITSDRPGSVTFNASLTTPHPEVMIASEGDEITLSGISSNHEGLRARWNFRACHRGSQRRTHDITRWGDNCGECRRGGHIHLDSY